MNFPVTETFLVRLPFNYSDRPLQSENKYISLSSNLPNLSSVFPLYHTIRAAGFAALAWHCSLTGWFSRTSNLLLFSRPTNSKVCGGAANRKIQKNYYLTKAIEITCSCSINEFSKISYFSSFPRQTNTMTKNNWNSFEQLLDTKYIPDGTRQLLVRNIINRAVFPQQEILHGMCDASSRELKITTKWQTNAM